MERQSGGGKREEKQTEKQTLASTEHTEGPGGAGRGGGEGGLVPRRHRAMHGREEALRCTPDTNAAPGAAWLGF